MRAALIKSQAQLTTPILAPYWLCAHMMEVIFLGDLWSAGRLNLGF